MTTTEIDNLAKLEREYAKMLVDATDYHFEQDSEGDPTIWRGVHRFESLVLDSERVTLEQWGVEILSEVNAVIGGVGVLYRLNINLSDENTLVYDVEEC